MRRKRGSAGRIGAPSRFLVLKRTMITSRWIAPTQRLSYSALAPGAQTSFLWNGFRFVVRQSLRPANEGAFKKVRHHG
jgi:hypothetical protein